MFYQSIDVLSESNMSDSISLSLMLKQLLTMFAKLQCKTNDYQE